MFGDSPWDYMSEEKRAAKRKEWAEKDKARKKQAFEGSWREALAFLATLTESQFKRFGNQLSKLRKGAKL